ncbi:hypothetical protein B0J18DRAFT_171150 [Chaetomium sp. MPI-SDFR-AT-0129]|nr:hypothetical protein B0J18DRAFT_171150 [Chaetomium sp. MPI-SDFR-AT-0129]
MQGLGQKGRRTAFPSFFSRMKKSTHKGGPKFSKRPLFTTPHQEEAVFFWLGSALQVKTRSEVMGKSLRPAGAQGRSDLFFDHIWSLQFFGGQLSEKAEIRRSIMETDGERRSTTEGLTSSIWHRGATISTEEFIKLVNGALSPKDEFASSQDQSRAETGQQRGILRINIRGIWEWIAASISCVMSPKGSIFPWRPVTLPRRSRYQNSAVSQQHRRARIWIRLLQQGRTLTNREPPPPLCVPGLAAGRKGRA